MDEGKSQMFLSLMKVKKIRRIVFLNCQAFY